MNTAGCKSADADGKGPSASTATDHDALAGRVGADNHEIIA